MSTLIKTVILILSVSFLNYACSKNNSGDQTNQTPKSEISLAEISNENCLNIEKYKNAFFQLYPVPPLREVTTNVRLSSEKTILNNFKLRMSLGNFSLQNASRNEILMSTKFHQEDCKTVSIPKPNGSLVAYSVTLSTSRMLEFENENQERYQFEWVSPQSFKLSHTYLTGDYLCDESSRIWVDVDRDYSWEGTITNEHFFTENFINHDYLQTLSEATNFPIDSFFVDVPGENGSQKMISIDQLNAMKVLSLKKEAESCSP